MSGEATGFLYPFIDAEERDTVGVLAELAASARAKMELSASVRRSTLADVAGDLEAAGAAMAERFQRGGRLFCFGNGGSATEADGAVELFRQPPAGRSLPALSLVDDWAVLTALANDVGYELVFSRQLIAHGRPGDVAIGFSTSGDSPNVLRAFEEAARRDILSIGLAGYEGGAMAGSGQLAYCFVVPSDSVHRIQEAQDAVVFALWSVVQDRLGSGGPA